MHTREEVYEFLLFWIIIAYELKNSDKLLVKLLVP